MNHSPHRLSVFDQLARVAKSSIFDGLAVAQEWIGTEKIWRFTHWPRVRCQTLKCGWTFLSDWLSTGKNTHPAHGSEKQLLIES
jgi:hypothetical protein